MPLLRVALPSVVEPSLKVTVPVGVPAIEPAAEAVAVNVTACPDTTDAADEARTVPEADGVAVVGGKAAHHHVVVAGEPRQAVAGNVDAAVAGVVVVQDVVEDDVARTGILDVQRPARVGGEHNGVVGNDVIFRAAGGVDLVEGDAAGVVVVQQVVLDARILHAVAVDAGAAAGPIVVDDVPF